MPTWTVEVDGAGVAVTVRYVRGPGGLVASQTVGGEVSFPLFTPHGEVWATTDPAGAITSWGDHDEFGVGLSGDTTGRYGWLGRQQRETDPSGLVLMGVRLYQPDLGRS